MNEKEQLLQSINAAAPVVGQMYKLETEITALEAEVEKKSHYGCGTVLILGLGLLFGMIGLGTGTLILIAFMAACIFFLVNRIRRVIVCKSTIAQSQQKLSLLRQDNSLSWLPEIYRTSSCIAAINSYLSDGRADSLKEALNLLETEMHQQRLENSAFLGAYFANKSN